MPASDRHLVRCFLRARGKILVVKTDERWDAISMEVQNDAESTAHTLVQEVTTSDAHLVHAGTRLYIPQDDGDLYVYPFLFEGIAQNEVALSDPHEWIPATDLLGRPTTPELWAAYAEVAASVDTVECDREHGASYLSVRALEVLRDWAGRLSWQQQRGQRLSDKRLRDTVYTIATRLIDAQPSMAVLKNRINRVMSEAGGTIADIPRIAQETITQAFRADEEAARRCAQIARAKNVLTLSRSETVIRALSDCRPSATVYVMESCPGKEGRATSRLLNTANCDVTILPDAAVASLLQTGRVHMVITGADAIGQDGVVNKVGSHAVALAAQASDVPCYAVASTDKISRRITSPDSSSEEFAESVAPIKAYCPLYEVTPQHLLAGIITERGVLTPEALDEISAAHGRNESWH